MPDDKDAHYNWGRALSSSGRYEEAIERYKKIIVIDPNDHEAYNSIGIALYETQQYEEAKDRFKESLELDKDYMHGHINLSLVFMQQNCKLEGFKFIRRGILDLDDNEKARLDVNQKYEDYLSLEQRTSSRMNKVLEYAFIDLSIIVVITLLEGVSLQKRSGDIYSIVQEIIKRVKYYDSENK